MLRRIIIIVIVFIMIGGYILFKGASYNKKYPRHSEIEKFLKQEKFDEVYKIVLEIENQEGVDKNWIRLLKRTSVEGMAISLYQRGLKFLNNRQYAEAIEYFNGLQNFLVQTLAVLEFEPAKLKNFLSELEKDKEKTIPAQEVKLYRDKYQAKAREIFGQDSSIIEILVDAMFMQETCKLAIEQNSIP